MSDTADLERHEASLEALAGEISELGKEIQNYTHGSDKYFGLAITVIVAAITLAVSNQLPAALVALPFALAGILLYVVQLMTERAARVGMRRYLEQHLRANPSYWYACKEDCLDAAVSQARPSVLVSTVLYALAYLASCGVAIITATQMDAPLATGAFVTLLTLLLAIVTTAMIAAFRELIRAENQSFAYMQRRYEHPDDRDEPSSWRKAWRRILHLLHRVLKKIPVRAGSQ